MVYLASFVSSKPVCQFLEQCVSPVCLRHAHWLTDKVKWFLDLAIHFGILIPSHRSTHTILLLISVTYTFITSTHSLRHTSNVTSTLKVSLTVHHATSILDLLVETIFFSYSFTVTGNEHNIWSVNILYLLWDERLQKS